MKACQEGGIQCGLPTSDLGGSRAVVVPWPGSQTENGVHTSIVGRLYVHGLQQIWAWLTLGFSSTKGSSPPRRKEGADL